MHDIVMKLKMPNLPKPRPSDLAMVGVAFLMFVGSFQLIGCDEVAGHSP
jgi:hypothetical protein